MSAVEKMQYPAGPLKNVWLRNGYELLEDKWGSTIKYVDLAGLARALLNAVMEKPGRLSGGELAYLRQKLDLSQSQCANLLGVEEQTLSLWERGKHPVPQACDALFRKICVETKLLRKLLFRSVSKIAAATFVQLASEIRVGNFICDFDAQWRVSFESPQIAAILRAVNWTKSRPEIVASVTTQFIQIRDLLIMGGYPATREKEENLMAGIPACEFARNSFFTGNTLIDPYFHQSTGLHLDSFVFANNVELAGVPRVSLATASTRGESNFGNEVLTLSGEQFMKNPTTGALFRKPHSAAEELNEV